jgi:hypothetical protein
VDDEVEFEEGAGEEGAWGQRRGKCLCKVWVKRWCCGNERSYRRE